MDPQAHLAFVPPPRKAQLAMGVSRETNIAAYRHFSDKGRLGHLAPPMFHVKHSLGRRGTGGVAARALRLDDRFFAPRLAARFSALRLRCAAPSLPRRPVRSACPLPPPLLRFRPSGGGGASLLHFAPWSAPNAVLFRPVLPRFTLLCPVSSCLDLLFLGISRFASLAAAQSLRVFLGGGF